MAAQEQLNRHAQDFIAGMAATARALWTKACAHDRIPPDTKFAVFSRGNRYAEFHQICMHQLFEARREYAAGGYVGLSIRDRNLPSKRGRR